jgi:hypothetical protein
MVAHLDLDVLILAVTCGVIVVSAACWTRRPTEGCLAGTGRRRLMAVVATHAQRLRPYQADWAPRARVVRRARDATAELTVTRLADGAGVASFPGTPMRPSGCGPAQPSTSRSWPGRCSCPRTASSSGSTRSATTGAASSVHSPTPKHDPPQELRHRQRRLATGNSSIGRVPELDRN